MTPKALILHASGINRDHEAAWACERAGARPDIVHISALRNDPHRLDDYQLLVVAGGFSYGDALGAGKRLALELSGQLGDALYNFADEGRPILGICNGFQALIKSGLLPEVQRNLTGGATLTHNAGGHFECRWVTLVPNESSPCVFTRELAEPIDCPIAHGEGRLASTAEIDDRYIALRYANPDMSLNDTKYPANPNGSVQNIAGVCNERGNVLGLMPHPEDHIVPWEHPRWTRGEGGRLGLPLFEAGVRYAAGLGR